MNHMTVVLVHGTWPVGFLRSLLGRWQPFRRVLGPDPQMWSDCPGPFQKELSALLPPGTDIFQFRWTGLNGIKARRAAAHKLAELIDDVERRRETRIYVVAHSHGGNVALDAHSISKTPLAGLVMLATPFISTSSRSWTDGQTHAVRTLANSLKACLFLGLVLPLHVGLTTLLEAVLDDNLPLWIILASMFCAICFVAGAQKVIYESATFNRLRNRARAWKEDWNQYLCFSRKELPCLSIRATGDEAHAALILAQLFNTTQTLLSRAISSFAHRTFNRPLNSLLPYGLFMLLGWTAFIFGIEWISGQKFFPVLFEVAHTLGIKRENAFLLVYGILFLPMAVIFLLLVGRFALAVIAIGLSLVILLIASLPFGPGLAPLSLWVEAHVETGPTDFIYDALGLSKNTVDDAHLSFRHSITTLPEVCTATAHWLCDTHRGGSGSSIH